MRKIILALLISITGAGCVPGRQPQHRTLFDAGGMQVISVFANRTDKTLSILYGDSAALIAARSEYRQSDKEGQLTLVTYHQADNRFWYGSLVNGAIKSVEHIGITPEVGATPAFAYRLSQGQPPADASGHMINAGERIRQILAHRPVVFP